MMNPYRVMTICLLPMVVCALLPSGCARSQRPRLYLLSSLESTTTPSVPTSQTDELSLSVAPITIPEYLDRPQIVTRSGANTIELAEFDRWAEPLKRNLARVMAENLALLLRTERVFLYPSQRAKSADIRVSLEVIRLDGSLNTPTRLQVRWTLLDNKGASIAPKQSANYRSASSPTTYEEMVGQYTQLIALMSEEIAAAIGSHVASK